MVGPSAWRIAMGRSENIPWPRLRDYLLQVSTCRTLDDCMRAACVEMQKVIPFDATAGIFRMHDNFNIAGVGREACQEVYNGYYRKRAPRIRESIVDWHRYDGEYQEDFLFPNGMHKAVRRVVAEHNTWISVVRSRRAPDFSEVDVDILALVEDYLNSLFESFKKLKGPPDPKLSAEGIAEQFRVLSPREAEVCSLIASRLNTAEMAARLFISGRTVENHVANIFDKLDVRSREQLRFRLGVFPF
jgi:DNA-binding CsgD family transcriptional regulator